MKLFPATIGHEVMTGKTNPGCFLDNTDTALRVMRC
jgi:hypothetical protein